MTRGERIAEVIRKKFYSKDGETQQLPDRSVSVRNPTSADAVNPLGLPSHVPASADSNDPTGTGRGGTL